MVNPRDQDAGYILIMSAYKKISGHVNQISIKNFIKQILGVIIQKHIDYLQYQLVMKKQQKTQCFTQQPQR